MRQAYRILPVYTGDVSGVCSALFELGGMVVIHDPSGCNSTYNTHDETRWYDQESLIFISGLRDVDAIMGDDEKLVDDVVEAAGQTHPRFIVLVGSPVPYQLGTDFAAIARLVQGRLGIPTWHLPTNGMHDYVRGASLAFELLARKAVADVPGAPWNPAGPGAAALDPIGSGPTSSEPTAHAPKAPAQRVNVLGLTPLDFAAPGTREALEVWLGRAGLGLVSCWAMGDSLDALARAGEADANLVLSATGMRAARVLEERFGQPYVVGVPMGAFAEPLARALAAACVDGRSRLAYQEARASGRTGATAMGLGPDLQAPVLVGEPVSMGSLAASLELAGQAAATRVICPVEDADGLVDPVLGDARVRGEEEAARALAGATQVYADPFYQLICDQRDQSGFSFHRLPHLALSGRQWLGQAPNLVGPSAPTFPEAEETA